LSPDTSLQVAITGRWRAKLTLGLSVGYVHDHLNEPLFPAQTDEDARKITIGNRRRGGWIAR
jgi:hypothetical protein